VGVGTVNWGVEPPTPGNSHPAITLLHSLADSTASGNPAAVKRLKRVNPVPFKLRDNRTSEVSHVSISSSRSRPVWARERCRISPPRLLAECCSRQLNRGSFVSLYFRLFTLSDLC